MSCEKSKYFDKFFMKLFISPWKFLLMNVTKNVLPVTLAALATPGVTLSIRCKFFLNILLKWFPNISSYFFMTHGVIRFESGSQFLSFDWLLTPKFKILDVAGFMWTKSLDSWDNKEVVSFSGMNFAKNSEPLPPWKKISIIVYNECCGLYSKMFWDIQLDWLLFM